MIEAAQPMDDLGGLHVALLTSWASHLGGGVATAVWQQARMIRAAGGRVTIVALADEGSSEGDLTEPGIAVLTAPVQGPRQIGYAPALAGCLDQADPDILHLHGIWMYPSHAGARWARRTGRPYLISPHGMLDPWITARGRVKKAVARLAYEQDSWARAAALHALTRDEANDIAREAGASRPVLVIPNAGPVASTAPLQARAPHVLYLGRIHPKKNLDALLDAWAVAQLPVGAELHIAGWGDGADMAAFQQKLGTAPDGVQFHGAVHGADKARLLAAARWMILPSHSEGLPMAILESWAAGTPTIMTAACHLPEGVETGAALPCGTDVPSVVRALEQALQLDPAEWERMAQAALALARGRFAPAEVTRAWVAAYRGLARPHGQVTE
ncbi:glycosyltransferase [Croceibacterium ferulae]|uniref:glycosyltransferase n=1 Tax=Croceibacterium ferulae TaxID=1854641 RepID=UPI0013904F09|nr:glycosyltransferase [Croceibacterium ferulae]